MRHLISILCTLGIIFISCGCDRVEERPTPSKPEIILSEQGIEVGCESVEHLFAVTSTDSWVAQTECGWIILHTDSGCAGTEQLKFRVERNEEVKSRAGVILIQNELGTLSAEFLVEQQAFVPTEISLSSASLNFGFEGGVQQVSITCNYDYDIDVDCSWLSYQRSDSGVEVTVEPSVVCQERRAEILIFSQRYNISTTLAVVQAPFVPQLDIEKVATLDFEYTGGAATIAIASNFEYDIVCESDWITVEKSATGLNVVVEPLYPVLNIPRSASFRIVDNLYDCGDTEIKVSQSCKDGDFAIGDMLEFNGVRGVVFYRSGDVTKIVSVEQGKSCWSTEYIAIDATDKDNGRKNMAVVQAVESWESKYPAFAWCANLGEGWYLPAKNELYALYNAKSSVNEVLKANGYTAIGVDYNYYYWSSTQSDNNNAYKLYFSTGVWDYYYKYSEYFVRAIYIL